MADQTFRTSNKTSGGLKYLLPSLLIVNAVWNDADALPKYRTAGITFGSKEIDLASPAQQMAPNVTLANGIELNADRQGHFRGTALINNVAMPFMIDTGTTMTIIPAKWANAADLPVGQPIQTHTAGGEITDQMTRINSLQIGSIQIRNLDALINIHVDEVLVGMNALRYFHLTQSEGTLLLVLDEQAHAPYSNTDNLDQPSISVALEPEYHVKKPTVIKKTVSCNALQLCRTTYSDREVKARN
ncbi:MAG: retropepsin-like aspartic protease family protein [Methylomonas sp.]